jgi:opine dehydrogenase
MLGAAGEGLANPALITDDLAEAVRGADLVCIVTPTTAHGDLAAQLAPLLDDGQPVFLNPGHTCGGLHFVTELRRNGYSGGVRCCETATLTYGCRIGDPGEVDVHGVMTNLPFSAFPGKHLDDLAELVAGVYPDIAPVANVLETSFANLNAVEHPPQALLNIGWLEHTQGDYLFYYHGTTPSVGRVIDALDEEKLRVAEALGIHARSFLQRFYETGYTTAHALEVGTSYQALQESANNRWVKGPKSLDHRYIHEDVGCGLVAWQALGRWRGVTTPTMDALIQIASVANGRNYATEGFTLERIGMDNIPFERLHEFLVEGTLTSVAA